MRLGGKESWQMDWKEPCTDQLCLSKAGSHAQAIWEKLLDLQVPTLQPRQEVTITVPGPVAKCICRQFPAVPSGQNSLSILLQSVMWEICLLWALHKSPRKFPALFFYFYRSILWTVRSRIPTLKTPVLIEWVGVSKDQAAGVNDNLFVYSCCFSNLSLATSFIKAKSKFIFVSLQCDVMPFTIINVVGGKAYRIVSITQIVWDH